MASPSYTEDLTCSICLSLFSDPVSLPCLHSFCRLCVSEALRTQSSCPLCRDDVPTGETNLTTNHIVKSLADRAREEEKRNEQRKNEAGVTDMMCREHEEKLKLFCETDQQLVCVICRDGQQHDGHKFKPIKEAAILMRAELEKAIHFLIDDNNAIERLVGQQRLKMRETEEKTCQLVTQISSQFEEMHQFLRKREEEIKNTLLEKEEKEVTEMTETLNGLESIFFERKETERKMESSRNITDSAEFMKAWCDEVKPDVESLKIGEHRQFRSRACDLCVTPSSLSVGPYETYLQFFVWKEMLQEIKPLPERLSKTTEQFTHYQKYAIFNRGRETEMPMEEKPRKIGVYVNCSSRELSFYNADNMKLIYIMTSPEREMQQPDDFFGLNQATPPVMATYINIAPLAGGVA
ncbi:nuclear factor 7, ovary-like [Aplochiton taeniatus]